MGAHDIQGLCNAGIFRHGDELITHDITDADTVDVDILSQDFEDDVAIGEDAHRGFISSDVFHHQHITNVMCAHQLDCTAQ